MSQVQEPARVFFDVVLTPHRSLGPRGFLIVMTLLAVVSFVSGIVFVSIGAWPVFGFFGLDVALVYLAFKANYRAAGAFETITLTEGALTIRRVSAKGCETCVRLEPAWLRVEMDEPCEQGAPLLVGSHGRSHSIGSFLSPGERLDLANTLRGALARRQAALIER